MRVGRKPKEAVEKFVRRQLTLPPELDVRVEALASVRGLTVSALLRELLERELEESERGHAETVAGIGAIEALERAGYDVRKRETGDAD